MHRLCHAVEDKRKPRFVIFHGTKSTRQRLRHHTDETLPAINNLKTKIMKKLVVFLMTILSSILTNAQITMEKEYSQGGVSNNDLSIVKLYSSGYKYQTINKKTNEIKLYNLNHSLFKTITIPFQTDQVWEVLYISEKLFNTDSSDIAYLVQGLSPEHYIKIYDETGKDLLTVDSASLGGYNSLYGYDPIFKTDSGTKMILNSNIYGWGRVYSLPGTDKTNLIPTVENNDFNISSLSNPYPNPSDEYTRIDYKLPSGVNEGEMVFFDVNGRKIKQFNIDRSFGYLIISTTDLPAGTYYYTLQTVHGITEGKKMIIIK